MAELRECPLCGSTDVTTKTSAAVVPGGLTMILCWGCGATVSFDRKERKAQAITAWNTRAYDAELEGLRVKLAELDAENTSLQQSHLDVYCRARDAEDKLAELQERFDTTVDRYERHIARRVEDTADSLDKLAAYEDAEEQGLLVRVPEGGIGELSDGYHTFNELYHHRAVLFSVICNRLTGRAWKSKLHDDGSMFDGMFIVGFHTWLGTATYHYDVDPYWEYFQVAELERAPKWDGHTCDEAIERLRMFGIPATALEKEATHDDE